MKTNESKKLTSKEFETLVKLLSKAENENIETLEGLESLIRSMVALKKLRHEN